MFCSHIYVYTVVSTAVVSFSICLFLTANVKSFGTALSSYLSINLSKNYFYSGKRINELMHIVVTACSFYSVESFHNIRLTFFVRCIENASACKPVRKGIFAWLMKRGNSYCRIWYNCFSCSRSV